MKNPLIKIGIGTSGGGNMGVSIWFTFTCPYCMSEMKENGLVIDHPTEKKLGAIGRLMGRSAEAIQCEFAGSSFAHPFMVTATLASNQRQTP